MTQPTRKRLKNRWGIAKKVSNLLRVINGGQKNLPTLPDFLIKHKFQVEMSYNDRVVARSTRQSPIAYCDIRIAPYALIRFGNNRVTINSIRFVYGGLPIGESALPGYGLPTTQPVLTMESAQRIVTGALKEDSTNPQTIVAQIIDNNHKLATIIIENNKLKKIAWIIDMHLFFTGDLFNDAGYNLTVGIEQQHNIKRGDH